MSTKRIIRNCLGAVAVSAALASATPAAFAGEDVFGGYSGQDFLFNGAGHSGTLKGGIMDTVGTDFAGKTGVNMSFDTFCCGVAKLEAAQQSGDVPWQIVAFSTMSDLRLAQKADLLLKIDKAIVPVGQLQDGTYDDTAIYGYPYAAVVAWNTAKWPVGGKHPKAIEDIFDTASFPGKRCLYKYPQFGGTMEAALLADGVPADKLYPLDVQRALASLNKIRDDIVWWSSGSQGVQQLMSGACDVALVWNGPVSDAIRANNAPFAIAWGHAIWDYTPVTIPKGVKNEKAAQAFLKLMIEDRAAQEKFVAKTAYVLMPLKDQVAIPDDVKPWVLAGGNTSDAIREGDQYYMDNIDGILKQFNSWVVSGNIAQ
ncbi:extracellular solute-binding protein [Mesorhizobium sp. B3-1-3]|uniref:extracellular solute-binding protein n=1 Tax=unclassified Mesorhizobium TaxID=325217 RepID=UPI001127DE9F|nr:MULTISPECIES: extracellular solute-binding protein [unclassified Mesorhizobium]TPI67144.1 extracellular solute-binding protein [Mesorhizobium sp. B3-1-8]TPI70374.1 extracellular solute-binding protein [Mesorhizobium sp. B3-1-3]